MQPGAAPPLQLLPDRPKIVGGGQGMSFFGKCFVAAALIAAFSACRPDPRDQYITERNATFGKGGWGFHYERAGSTLLIAYDDGEPCSGQLATMRPLAEVDEHEREIRHEIVRAGFRRQGCRIADGSIASVSILPDGADVK